MNRRTFLKASAAIIAAVSGVVPVAFSGENRSGYFHARNGPHLPGGYAVFLDGHNANLYLFEVDFEKQIGHGFPRALQPDGTFAINPKTAFRWTGIDPSGWKNLNDPPNAKWVDVVVEYRGRFELRKINPV
jgi:hypothetical protein